ncbi:DUF5605 domain-containing protein [Streptomyces sp. NPDC013978]|uniref:DUF5605 domain-containing protein n=1 Tax=Streptomyces sp. NPDC013978 TaxID=3364869 RepID=UPI0036FF5D02
MRALWSPGSWSDFPFGGVEGRHLLAYFGTGQPRRRTFLLRPGVRYRADVLDTWNMTVSELLGSNEGDFHCRCRPYIAVRLRAVEG